MAEYNSIEWYSHETLNMYRHLSTALSNKQQFTLNRIYEVKDYFVTEIKDWELMCKRFSKYIASLDYFDKSFIVLSVATGCISIASSATVTGVTVGMMSAICSLAFPKTTGIVKKNY